MWFREFKSVMYKNLKIHCTHHKVYSDTGNLAELCSSLHTVSGLKYQRWELPCTLKDLKKNNRLANSETFGFLYSSCSICCNICFYTILEHEKQEKHHPPAKHINHSHSFLIKLWTITTPSIRSNAVAVYFVTKKKINHFPFNCIFWWVVLFKFVSYIHGQ